MRNNSFFKFLFFLAGIFLFVSCDKDYSSVGEGLIGDNNFELTSNTFSVVAHNEKITPVQSNNLLVNALGIYDNPAFGKTTANFVTQLILGTVNPTFTTINTPPAIDSVYLSVPYFINTSKTTPITEGGYTYELDSIYGEPKAKIKLSIYESGRDMGTQIGTAQTFYTNQNNDEFDNFKIPYLGNRLNDDVNKAQNDEFFFDPAQHIETTKDATDKKTYAYSPPGMRLKLNANFFESKIIKAPSASLAANDVFMNYFKGLYFKVEQSGSDKGSLAMINFANGKITIYYKEDKKTKEDDPATTTIDETVIERVQKSIILKMIGNTASLLTDINKTEYQTATTAPSTNLEAEKLYIKGGEGSVAVLELFSKEDLIGYDTDGNLTGPNQISDELDKMRKERWLINKANLVFNIDTENTDFKNSPEPERLYLYDYDNNTTIFDYYLGAATTNKNTSKILYGGFIKRDATTLKRGISYSFNITNHIINLVKNSATNAKLGLAVTEDINIPDMVALQSSSTSKAPKASVMNPLGTILYGSAATVPEDKKIKLEIHYTKPK